VAIELLTRDYGRPDFQRNEQSMMEALPATDPAGGISGLPEPLLSGSLQVIAFYDSIGILVAFGCIDEELVLTAINYRIRRIWQGLEPFIRAEREFRGGLYLDFLEDLAVRAHRTDPRQLAGRLGLQEMPTATSPSPLVRQNQPPGAGATRPMGRVTDSTLRATQES